MGNPYYIPVEDPISKAGKAANFANSIQEGRRADRSFNLAERVQTHNEDQDAFLRPIQKKTSNAQMMNAQTNQAQLPAHKQPFKPAKVMKARMQFEQKMGKDAKAFEGFFNFFDTISQAGGSNAAALDDAMGNWGFLQGELTNGYTKMIETKAKANPGWLDTPEGAKALEELDEIKTDQDGQKFLFGKMFRGTMNSIISEDRDRELEERIVRVEEAAAGPETFSEPFTDQFGNLVQKSDRTGKITKVSSPQKGMVVSSSPDGGIVVRTGVNSNDSNMTQLPRGAVTSFTKEYVANQQGLDAMQQIATLYEPEFLTYGGAVKGAAATVMNKWDPKKRSKFQARRAKFKSAVGREFLRFRKWATGVAGGEKEMAEIKRISFSEEDSPQDFEAKLELAQSLYRRLNVRLKAALNSGIDNEADFKRFIGERPLDSIPTIQQRGDELLDADYTEDQIKSILVEEGYINQRNA